MLTAKQKKQPNFKKGQSGEQQAAKYLTEIGYKIIAANIQTGTFELDLIARDPEFNELVFVEVKQRRNKAFGHPSRAVNSKKLRKMTIAAERYMRQQQLQMDYRFDIIAITGSKLEHFKNISWNFWVCVWALQLAWRE